MNNNKKKKLTKSKSAHCVVELNPERVRNILTLEERVEAIRAYERRPMYTKIAKMYNCGWEQIRNIIANRDSIMRQYEAKQKLGTAGLDENEVQMKKIKFLGKCVYEYLQRFLFYYPEIGILEESICAKAREFRDLMKIETFVPNKAWIAHFKKTYHIDSFASLYLDPNRVPPNVMECKEILEYCKPLINTDTKITMAGQGERETLESEQDRQHQIDLLERSLCEYAKRAKALIGMDSTQVVLRKVALRLKEILKIDCLFLDKVWFYRFCDDYNVSVATDPRSAALKQPVLVDLHQIIDHCSNSPEYANKKVWNPPTPNASSSFDHSPFIEVKNEVINVDDDDDFDYSKGSLNRSSSGQHGSMRLKRKLKLDNDSQSSVFKIHKVESLSEDANSVSRSPVQIGDNDDETLYKTVQNYEDALKLLKPLEEFVMLEENFRAIGLISQLETIFKNPPRKDECL